MNIGRLTITRKQIITLWAYIEVILIIIYSGTVWSTDNSTIPMQIVRALLLLFGVSFFVFKPVGCHLEKGYIFFFLLTEILVCVNYCLFPEGAFTLQFKALLLFIFLRMIIVCQNRFIDLLHILYSTLFFIIVVTLMMYILVDFLHLSIPYEYFHLEGGVYYRDYLHLYYSYSVDYFLPRMCGIFWEPGAYEIYINIALYIYLTHEQKNPIQIVIILLSLLLCQSTTGYLIGLLQIGYLIISRKWYKKYAKPLLILLVFGMAGLAGSVIFVNKMISTNFENDSYYMRIRDISYALQLFFEHPVFGVGFGNIDEFLKVSGTLKGSSSGLLSWLYMTGTAGMLYIFLPFISFIIKEKNHLQYILMLIVFLLANNGEPFYNLSITILVVAFVVNKFVGRRSSENKVILNTEIVDMENRPTINV